MLNSMIGPLGLPLLYLGGMVVSILPSYLKHQGRSQLLAAWARRVRCPAVLFAFILVSSGIDDLSCLFIPMPALVYGVLYLAYYLVHGPPVR